MTYKKQAKQSINDKKYLILKTMQLENDFKIKSHNLLQAKEEARNIVKIIASKKLSVGFFCKKRNIVSIADLLQIKWQEQLRQIVNQYFIEFQNTIYSQLSEALQQINDSSDINTMQEAISGFLSNLDTIKLKISKNGELQ